MPLWQFSLVSLRPYKDLLQRLGQKTRKQD